METVNGICKEIESSLFSFGIIIMHYSSSDEERNNTDTFIPSWINRNSFESLTYFHDQRLNGSEERRDTWMKRISFPFVASSL